jgi:ferredoxin
LTSDKAVLTIDEPFCIGCGLCSKLLPAYFELIDKKATVKKQIPMNQENELIKQGIEKCPAKAIKYKG